VIDDALRQVHDGENPRVAPPSLSLLHKGEETERVVFSIAGDPTSHALHLDPRRQNEKSRPIGPALVVSIDIRAYFASVYLPSFTVSRMRERSSRP